MGRQVFGCDICQDVCPWNRKAPIAADAQMEPRPELVNPPLTWLAGLTEEEFGRLFYGSPVKRAKYAGLRRNVAIAMGNSGDREFVPQLEAWAREGDPVLAETAAWALAQILAERSTAV
jgi:epoxyqueuosine reductase